jgi:hypothetical protein
MTQPIRTIQVTPYQSVQGVYQGRIFGKDVVTDNNDQPFFGKLIEQHRKQDDDMSPVSGRDCEC